MTTKICYSLNRRDLFWARMRSVIQNRLIQLNYVALAIFVFWLDAKDVKGPFLLKAIAGGLGASICVLIGFGLTALFISIGVLKKNAGILCEHEIEITDDGLIERTSVNESLHRWSAFHKTAVRGDGLHIHATETQIHLIPRRFFRTPEQMREFRAEIEKRVSDAMTSKSRR